MGESSEWDFNEAKDEVLGDIVLEEVFDLKKGF
jgi:hypothetical protein